MPSPPSAPAALPAPRRFGAEYVVILAGVCAALHVAKLPPAIPALQQALGISLVQAGFLLSLVQLAGMSAGLVFGALADGIGLRRSLLLGLGVLALASGAGAFATSAPWLMALRAAEGFGFLLVVLAAPALVRRLVAPGRLSLAMGLWGAYMPLGATLALLSGPLVIGALGWPAWWAVLALVSLAMAGWVAIAVREPAPGDQSALTRAFTALRRQLPTTLGAAGPWLLAGAFAVYAGQWLAVIGFLPTVYSVAGVAPAAAGVLTALAAAINMVGNVMAGRWLHRGARPQRLLRVGYTTMAVMALVAFAPWSWPGGAAVAADPAAWVRYGAVLAFSGVGGLVPATLFALALPATPREGSLSSTVGWIQQWSALGQFGGPPLAAWVAAKAGGWQLTWVVCGVAAAAGLVLTGLIARAVVPSMPQAPRPHLP